jgi:triosephosphate isomerase (TIM)
MLIINLKTYHESMGQDGLELIKQLDLAAQDSPVDVLLAVNALDIESAAKIVSHVKIIAQHADPVGYGAHTGQLGPEELKNRGAVGTLLNHSEHRIPDELLGDAIDLAQAHFPDYTIVCTPSFEHACKIDHHWDPHLIAYEPPELIGGDISVTSSKPEIIKKVVGISIDRQILVGAGVKTVEDIKASLDMGAIGVLVASGVVKNTDPAKVVKEFLSAWE